MKRVLQYIIIFSVSLAITSCLKEMRKESFEKGEICATIKVQLKVPEGIQTHLEGLEVKFTEQYTGLEYTGTADENGMVSVDVTYGSYYGVTNARRVAGSGMIDIFNGSTDKIRVTPEDPEVVESVLQLNYSKTGQFVIKEIYFGGCWNENTNKAYTGKDMYFTIYNNTYSTAYLDSICVGIINPLNAPSKGKLSDWVKPGTTELRDSIPCGTMVWMFKGDGKSLPLAPGEEVVCSVNAINHTIAVPASVNLGKTGYFAMYDPMVTTKQSTPEPGVELMDLIWKTGPGTAFPFSIGSPGVLIFSLGDKPLDEFIKANHKANPTKPTNPSFDCLLVDKNLVIDGVECLKQPSDSKRFRPEVDNGFAMISSTGTGRSIMRKVDAELTIPGGVIIYMDTNNSTNDFEVLPFATLTGKK